MKQYECISCPKKYDTLDGNFQRGKTKSGYRGQCKTCCTKKRAEWVKRNQAREKERLAKFNKTKRQERREEGRYNEKWSDRDNALRNERNKYKRIHRKTARWHRNLYYQPEISNWMDGPERKAMFEAGRINLN